MTHAAWIGTAAVIMLAGCSADAGGGTAVHSCVEALAATHTCLPYAFDTHVACDGFTTCGPCPCWATCSGGTLHTQQSGVARGSFPDASANDAR